MTTMSRALPFCRSLPSFGISDCWGFWLMSYLQSCQFQYVPVFVLPPSELYRWSEICRLYWRSSTRQGGRFVASCQSSPQDFQSLCVCPWTSVQVITFEGFVVALK